MTSIDAKLTKQMQKQQKSDNKDKESYAGSELLSSTTGSNNIDNNDQSNSPDHNDISHPNAPVASSTTTSVNIKKKQQQQQEQKKNAYDELESVSSTTDVQDRSSGKDSHDHHHHRHPVAASSSSGHNKNETTKNRAINDGTTTTTKTSTAERKRPVGAIKTRKKPRVAVVVPTTSDNAKEVNSLDISSSSSSSSKEPPSSSKPQKRIPQSKRRCTGSKRAKAGSKRTKSSSSSSKMQKKAKITDEQQQSLSQHEDSMEDDEYVIPNEEMEAKVAFCCYLCRCTQQRKDLVPVDDCFAISNDDGLDHRRCCHNLVQKPKDDWKPPIEMAMYELEMRMIASGANDPAEPSPPLPLDVVQEADQTLWRDIEEAYHGRDKPAADDPKERMKDEFSQSLGSLCLNAGYCRNEDAFAKLIHGNRSAVVLDLFAGIGSGIVALKRLGISIERVIHVEQDRVATLVYKRNHDPKCNLPNMNHGSPEAGIENVYFDNVDYVSEHYKDIINQHGYVDIILGAPPCLNYSDDVSHQRAMNCLTLMATLTQKIQEYQAEMEEGNHVYFLAEATAMSNEEYVGLDPEDCAEVQKAFGISWSLEVDAGLCSPVHRKSTIFSNVPVVIYPSDSIQPDSSACLMDKYKHGGWQLCRTARFPSFMTNKDKLDDDRMVVFYSGLKTENPRYLQRTLNSQERSNLMGFPSEYVQHPVFDLFTNLLQVGFGNRFTYEKYWKDVLAEEYHSYGGLDYKFVVAPGQDRADEVKLEMPVPSTTSNEQVFFNADQYAKYLIGGASSIPVWTILLRELGKKFATRVYPHYEYDYMWTPIQQTLIKNEMDPIEPTVKVEGGLRSEPMVKCEEDDDGGIDV